jgi:protein involved in polysaccharide export with SLBB domain
MLPEGSRRRIQLTGGVAALPVDLDRAEFLGEESADPCLYAGFTVVVPQRSSNEISVVGEVVTPKSIELVDGDDISTLIQLAGGATHNGNAAAARFLGEGTDLRAGRVIVVPPRDSTQSFAERVVVTGAVRSPKHISSTSPSTLRHVLAAADGITENANIERITVFRLQPANEWGVISRTRFAIAAHPGNSEDSDFQILPGDSVFVPMRTAIVTVEGEVESPGVFAYTPNKSGQFYIDAAGGFLSTAERAAIGVTNYVTKQTTKQSMGVIIRDGDKIVVAKSEGTK